MPDPVSHRTLGFRADVTTQVARIATTRLAVAPRPLRLMYAGHVLRVRGDQLEPERQFTQAGIELIGAAAGAADAEVILATVDALAAVGVRDITVDLALPTLGAGDPRAGEAAAITVPLRTGARPQRRRRDQGGRRAAARPLLCDALVEASGAFAAARERVANLKLCRRRRKAEWDSLVAVADAIRVGSARSRIDRRRGRKPRLNITPA